MTLLEQARVERDWGRPQLMAAMYRAAAKRGLKLPEAESLERLVKYFEKGDRPVKGKYLDVFCAVYGRQPEDLGLIEPPTSVPNRRSGEGDPAVELNSRLDAAASVDASLVALLEAQTQNFRLLDRRLGARNLCVQTKAHVTQLEELLRHATFSDSRPALASALTEAAALAGWQALDLGDVAEAWRLHDVARAAAREAGDPSVLAHATAQQAYALLDVGRGAEAVRLIRHAHSQDSAKLPPLLRSWLYAAEAEALSVVGDESGCHHALDLAADMLPLTAADERLPYLALDATHLARWRGNCLARLGSTEAIEDLSRALSAMDSSFTRAEAALRCDLATAFMASGDHRSAQEHARKAAELAANTSSIRQRKRIAQLLPAA